MCRKCTVACTYRQLQGVCTVCVVCVVFVVCVHVCVCVRLRNVAGNYILEHVGTTSGLQVWTFWIYNVPSILCLLVCQH